MLGSSRGGLSDKENDILLAIESDQLPKTQWFSFSPPKNAAQSAHAKKPVRAAHARPRPVAQVSKDEQDVLDAAPEDEETPTLKLMRFAATPWLNFGCAKFHANASSNVPVRRVVNIQNIGERTETVTVDKMSATNGFKAETETFEVPAGKTVPLAFTWTPSAIGNARENVTIKTNSLRLKVILFATGTERLGVKNVTVNVEVFSRDENGAAQVLTSSFVKTQETDDLKEIEKTKRANERAQQAAAKPRPAVFTSSRYSAVPAAQTPTSAASKSRLMSQALEMRTPLKDTTPSNARNAAPTTGKRISSSTLAESAVKRRKMAEADLKTPSKKSTQLTQSEVLESAVKGLFKKYAGDSRWMEKQETAFTEWLNFLLKNGANTNDAQTTTEERSVSARNTVISKISQNAAKSHLTPKQLSLLKRKSTVKQSARMFFTGSEANRVLGKLKSEIDCEKLRISSEKFIWADLSLRQHTTDLFVQNYAPHHLHLALETMFGEVIPLPSNAVSSSAQATALGKFFVKRVIFDDVVAAKYEGRIKELYQPGFKEALDKVVLNRILTLVWILDRFKTLGILEDNSFAGVITTSSSTLASNGASGDENLNLSCLFRNTSQVKSSNELLCLFAQHYLAAEGDIMRRMSLIGYSLHHHQTYLDEFDFRVNALSVDLRDGIRLARIAELLSKRNGKDSNLPSLLPTLRVPAISRLQKIHNVTQAMNRLKQCGVALPEVDARDLVDGKQAKTLAYLWQIILNAHLPHIVSVELLQRETARIAKNNLIASITAELKGKKSLSLREQGATAESDPSACIFFNSELFSAILEWAQSICAHYGVTIANFTTSFSDGRAFCYLIHYYAPELLDIAKVQQHTSTKLEENLNAALSKNAGEISENSDVNFAEDNFDVDALPTSPGPIDGNWVGVFSPPSGTSTQLKAVLEAETANFGLVRSAVSKLGFVPQLANSFDMSNTLPDEKVVVTFLACLSARLIELISEREATIAIQRAFRVWYSRCTHVREARATLKIQAFFKAVKQRREFDAIRRATITIQRAYREKGQREKARLTSAALFVQSRFRMILAKKYFLRLENAATAVQARWRMICTQKQVQKWEKAAVVIQKNRKMVLAQRRFQQLTEASITLQSAIRARAARIHAKRVKAALDIQCWWRMILAKKEFARKQQAALKIQSWWRMIVARKQFNKMQDAAVAMQCAIRTRQAKKLAEKRTDAIITIQSWYKMVSQRKKYESYVLEKKTNAALKIQSWWRMILAKKDFEKKNTAALKIQSWWRMVVAKKQFEAKQEATLKIQSWWRMITARKEYAKMTQAAIVLQTAIRARNARKLASDEFARKTNAALKIQSWWRMVQARRNFAELEKSTIVLQRALRERNHRIQVKREDAALKIQSWWRMILAKKRFGELERATLKLQTAFREKMARDAAARAKDLEIRTNAALTIQSWWKMILAKRQFARLNAAAIAIQSAIRAKNARELAKKTKAALQIQCWWRMILAKKEFARKQQAALKIQSWWRMIVARKQFNKMQDAAVAMQCAIRTRQAKKLAEKRTDAIITIQSWYKMVSQRKKYESYVLEKKTNAALKIQSWWRMILAKKDFEKKNTAALKIQSWWRMVVAKKQFEAKQEATLKIQSWWRMVSAKKAFEKQKWAALVVQRYRRTLLVQRDFERLNNAAITIQSAIRARKARIETEKLSATIKIQAFFRMVSQRREYQAYQLERRTRAALKIQSWWRMVLAQKEFAKKSNAALHIQSWWRMIVARKSFLAQKKAAEVVKTQWKAILAVKRYEEQRKAALCLQSRWRMIVERNRFEKLQKAAITIQAAIRSKLVQRRLAREEEAAKCIQKTWRAFVARREAEKQRKAVITIQAAVRAKMAREYAQRLAKETWAARIVQKRWRLKKAAQKEALTLENAVLRIQALYKGYRVRKDAKLARIAQLRAQIEHRRKNTPISQTLGYRTNAALKTLLEAQKLSDIVSACQVLEESTRYSDQCARYVIEVEAIPILFGVVATCNRSAPHVSVLKIILDVVTYICRWRETRSGLVAQQPDVLERLSNVATAFKDVPEVFNRACAAFISIAKPQPESAQAWLFSHAASSANSASKSSASSASSSSASTASSSSSNAALSAKSTLARLSALEDHVSKRLNIEKKAKKAPNLLALSQESLLLISQIHNICKKAATLKRN